MLCKFSILNDAAIFKEKIIKPGMQTAKPPVEASSYEGSLQVDKPQNCDSAILTPVKHTKEVVRC